MKDFDAAKQPAIVPALDRGEPVALMEPARLPEGSPYRAELMELAFELTTASAGFRHSLPAPVVASLADLVRSMNCYYSNLIEGHHTHPVDIERALKHDYSQEPEKRNLQLEAVAHVAVQDWIDQGGLAGRAATVEAILEIHRRFCEKLPPELLVVGDPKTGEKLPVVPGELRRRDVQVGQQVAVSPGAVPRFLERFEAAFSGLGKAETVVSVAAAHHRLVWIHPFLDGNGRVTRLVSHALLLEALDTGALWSVSRGLARQIERYKELLGNCDLPRQNDLDGRGHLSEEALAEFSRFFLETCIDQVRFMEQLVEPRRLRERVLAWVARETADGRLAERSDTLLDALLYRGELPRGEVARLLSVSDRHSRRIVSGLLERGALASASTKAPLRLAFPAALAHEWMPGLFPRALNP